MNTRTYFILFFTLFITVFGSACQYQDAAFGPIFPTPTHIGVVSRPPIPVDFVTLNSDPELFLDRQIQVSGTYLPLREPVCNRQRGPQVDWYLISDGLEMNVSGYGSIVSLTPEQSFFTIEGIWRVYRGASGCAKEPTQETVWYLDIIRIVDPNPIVAQAIPQGAVTVISVESSTSTPVLVQTPENEFSESTPDSITTTPTASPTSLVDNRQLTPTPSPTVFVVATSISETVTPTATQLSSDGSNTTPSPTPTVADGGNETETPTPTPTVEADDGDDDGLGGTGSGTPNPATPVPTQSGPYPESGYP
ncbi:MAG: hypothetical protein AAGD96_01125 [Chloroflexota bacterium]